MKIVVTVLAILLLCVTAQAQTIVNVPVGGSLQSAINSATRGSKITLEPGVVYSGNFNLIDKGPCTGAESDFITITTSDPAGTPSALFNYPHSDTRITTAMAARMPVVRTPNSYPAFWINRNSKCWRIERLNITNAAGSGTIRLIGLGEENPRGLAEFPDRITLQGNWIHPAEETGAPLTAATLHRSAENAIYLEGTNLLIQNNAIQGFVGKYSDGSRFASAGLLMSTWADKVLVQNNRMEAYSYTVFFGGGGGLIADPNQTGTVSSCTSLSCVFSNTNGITVGKPIAIGVYPRVVGGENSFMWGTARVASISGNTVTFQAPLCNSDNTGGNGNVCKPFDSANPQQIPSNGNPARWGGYQVQNILVRRNIISHPDEWTTFMGQCGGKGYLELKSGNDITFDGNIFKGCDGLTITTRNQSGADPWSNLNNLTFTNNWWHRANSPLTAYLNDDGNLTNRTTGYTFHNNLITGEWANPDEYNYLRVLSGNFNGGTNARITKNTMFVGSYRGFTTSNNPSGRMQGLVIEGNIIRIALNLCLNGPMTECWPGASVKNNVLMKIDPSSTDDEINQTWMNPFPNNFLVKSIAGVGFVNAPPSLDASGNYRLSATSPFKGKASDGKDIGVDIDQLNAAIFGSSPPPLPTPTPTPVPTPSPTPVPSPTSSPTPVPTPQPGTVTISGRTFSAIDGAPFAYMVVVLSDQNGAEIRRMQESEDATYKFSNLAAGSYQVHVAVPTGDGGQNASPSKIVLTDVKADTVGLSIQNFTIGPNAWFPTGPIACVPVACPSPTPTPTPQPSPSPSPTTQRIVLSPLSMQLEIGQSVQATATARDQANNVVTINEIEWLPTDTNPVTHCVSISNGLITGEVAGTCGVGVVAMTALGGPVFHEAPITVTVLPASSPTPTPVPTPSPMSEFGRFAIPRTASNSDPVEIRDFLNGPEVGGAGFSQCYVVVNVTYFRCLRSSMTPYEWKDWAWVNGNAERDALTIQVRQEGYSSIFVWAGRVWASKPKP